MKIQIGDKMEQPEIRARSDGDGNGVGDAEQRKLEEETSRSKEQ